MSVDFPSTPTVGQKYNSGTRRYRASATNVWDSDDYSALLRNRLVNPDMRISQQYPAGANVTGWTNVGSAYVADQWTAAWVWPAGYQWSAMSYAVTTSDGNASLVMPGHACIVHPNGNSPFGAASDFSMIYQRIEGLRVADFLWGTANARPVVLRFACAGEAGVSYSCGIKNIAENRSFFVRFTLAATSTWQEFVVAIPGCTDGVWATDNTAAMFVHFEGAVNTAYAGGTAGVWNANGTLTNSAFNGHSNGWGFRIAKVGLYLDPFGSGVAPVWTQPQYAEAEIELHALLVQGQVSARCLDGNFAIRAG